MSLSNSDNICHPSWAECPNFNGESPENPPEYRGLLSNDNPGFSGVYETNWDSFQGKILNEFCNGSGIDQDLFRAVIRVASDLETDAAGNPETPIHDALNWRYIRFGCQAKETLTGAILQQENGEAWQVKLAKPRKDKDKPDKSVKYETPVGAGSALFLPTIPDRIREKVARRYGLAVPLSGSFWDWVRENPQVPIVWTEGGKKALSLLSEGIVAIALIGVNGGYRNIAGVRVLTPAMLEFCRPGRVHTLAFDQDTKPETQRRVNAALMRFGGLIGATGGSVSVATWRAEQGKGIDDFKVSCGAASVDQALNKALPLNHWLTWKRLENQLTWKPSLAVNLSDLGELNAARIPDSGIVAIAGGKGTGKTNLLQKLADNPKTLLASHRIALARNLCGRLGVDYRGDLDKTPEGDFISGSAYTLRVGFCVDSLLAINPEKFRDCDLIIDEVCQVVRHLLTSSTCGKDGIRPALLARFRQLVQVARRVIIADADLDNATLHYIREMRGEDSRVFLLHNTHLKAGYPVTLYDSVDHSPLLADLLVDVESLPTGKALFVATDSKKTSEKLGKAVLKKRPDLRVLVINAKTSGGESERAFINNPDQEIENYDVVIASPSVGTGVSIQSDRVVRVYGFFTGGSINDADILQALGRVRLNVERRVWVAKIGTNFSEVSRATNPKQFKTDLAKKTSVNVSVVRSSLREDFNELSFQFDWQNDPHINLFCRLGADQNRAMADLRTAVLVRLRFEGNQVQVEKRESDAIALLIDKRISGELRQLYNDQLYSAEDLSYAEVKALEQQDSRTPEQELAIAKFHLKDFHCLDSLDLATIEADKEGQRRVELRSLEELVYPGIATDGAVRALEKQGRWNQGLCAWDISGSEARRIAREKLGLKDFLNPDKTWTAADLKPYADGARAAAQQVKLYLNLTITPKMSDTQIIHQLLAQLGVKVVWVWVGTRGSLENPKHKVYRLNQSCWNDAIAILQRRAERRERLASPEGSPPPLIPQNQGGDPKLEPLVTPDLEGLPFEWASDFLQAWEVCDSPEARRSVLDAIAQCQQVIKEPIAA